jgi:hypothetical protein
MKIDEIREIEHIKFENMDKANVNNEIHKMHETKMQFFIGARVMMSN